MRNELTVRTFWRLQLIGWLGLYALIVASALPYVEQRSIMLRNSSLGWGVWFLASCALRPICRTLMRRSSSWFQLEIRAFGWSALAGVSTAFFIELVVGNFSQLGWTDVISNSVRSSILLLFWCNLYFSIKQWERSASVEAEAREARLSALRYQLNPHFLFNSLNAASTLAVKGNIPATTRMLTQIADLLRTSLDAQLPIEVSLSDEIVFTKRYLAIEQTRLGDRLQVHFAIASETLEAAVPNMLLQPLVENAIRHGIAPVIEGGKVAIHSQFNGARLQIVIANTGPRADRLSRNPNGIGLANTTERLQTLYGDTHTMGLHWPDAGGCEVLIEIPFRRASHQAEKIACAY